MPRMPDGRVVPVPDLAISRLQLALQLLEEAPVGAVGDDLVRVRFDHPDLVHAQCVEPKRVLGIELPPPVVPYVGQRLLQQIGTTRAPGLSCPGSEAKSDVREAQLGFVDL